MLDRFSKGEVLTADKLNALVEAVNALESRLAVESITDVGPGLELDQSAAGTIISLSGNRSTGTVEAADESDFPFKISIETNALGRRWIKVYEGFVFWQVFTFENRGTSTRCVSTRIDAFRVGNSSPNYIDTAAGVWTACIVIEQYGNAADVIIEAGDHVASPPQNHLPIGRITTDGNPDHDKIEQFINSNPSFCVFENEIYHEEAE